MTMHRTLQPGYDIVRFQVSRKGGWGLASVDDRVDTIQEFGEYTKKNIERLVLSLTSISTEKAQKQTVKQTNREN